MALWQTAPMQKATEWIFSERFWLPPDISWKDFENKDGRYIAQASDLIYTIPVALTLYCIRRLFEKYVCYPIGMYMNVSSTTYSCPSNPQLENFYRKHSKSKPNESQLQSLSKGTDLSQKQIQRWLWKRKKQDKPSQMTKFTEAAWHLSYHIFVMSYGIAALWNKPWLTNLSECWKDDYPRQHVDDNMFWLYIISIGYYEQLSVSHFTNVRQKDFWESFIHHLATLGLLAVSWTCNFVRAGSLVLCIHIISDCFLEAAQLDRYTRRSTLSEVFFVIFAFTFFITRLFIFPYYIIHAAAVDATSIIGPTPALLFINVLLGVLQILHIIWFYMILKVVRNAVASGGKVEDVRSESDESADEKEESSQAQRET